MNPDEHNACFERWLNTHGAMLHHVANGFAVGADRHDLMQELLLAVWRAVPAFREGAQAGTFIYRVAHNAALTWRRRQKNYERRVEQFGAMVEGSAGGGGDAASGSARERETLELIYTHIRALPPVDRSLMLLHLDGVGYAEMAAIHGISESNVGVRISRLKQKLSEAIKEITHELR